MEAGILFLLLFTTFGIISAQTFYGQSVTFNKPRRNSDGTFKVIFYQRQNGRESCQDQFDFECDVGVCSSFQKSSVVRTDQDDTGQDRWCQSESFTTANTTVDLKTFSMRSSGCCWLTNLDGKTNWTAEAQMTLGIRSDSNTFNTCPVTTTVSYLRVPQNCFTEIKLLAYDPDEDVVRCRFANESSSEFTLVEDTCTLRGVGLVSIGVHAFDIVLEDFPKENISLQHSDGTTQMLDSSNRTSQLCKVTVQFSLEILPSIPSCEPGRVLPIFLPEVPQDGTVLPSFVGKLFQLSAKGEAYRVSIQDFQVSGPANLTKTFTDEPLGKATVLLEKTASPQDLFRIVPLCLTVETSESQSDLRCFVTEVNKPPNSLPEGSATVQCLSNMIVVALQKASFPGLDPSELSLLNRSCRLDSNATHIIATTTVSSCGTEIVDIGEYFLLRNVITSMELPEMIITRNKIVRITFSCRIRKTNIASTSFNIEPNLLFQQSGFESFAYTFDAYTDNTFETMIEPSSFPVEINLLSQIFLGIQVQSGLPNVTLFVESCRGTNDGNTDSLNFHSIIENGCPMDETLIIHPSDQLSFNFEVEAFRFTGTSDQIFITCSILLCDSTSEFSRCAQGCLTEPFRRRKRDLFSKMIRQRITTGPIQITDDFIPGAVTGDIKYIAEMKWSDPPSTVSSPPVPPEFMREGRKLIDEVEDSEGQTKAETSLCDRGSKIIEIIYSKISTTILAICFLLSLVVLAVTCKIARKIKAEDAEYLLHSG
ncbi:uncharacterized protein [Antennarius striatus]|uniref:uncharacterized protein n=1 Tax=Antennarius striatus TaxID=241820 RepID=UPI0035B3CB5F